MLLCAGFGSSQTAVSVSHGYRRRPRPVPIPGPGGAGFRPGPCRQLGATALHRPVLGSAFLIGSDPLAVPPMVGRAGILVLFVLAMSWSGCRRPVGAQVAGGGQRLHLRGQFRAPRRAAPPSSSTPCPPGSGASPLQPERDHRTIQTSAAGDGLADRLQPLRRPWPGASGSGPDGGGQRGRLIDGRPEPTIRGEDGELPAVGVAPEVRMVAKTRRTGRAHRRRPKRETQTWPHPIGFDHPSLPGTTGSLTSRASRFPWRSSSGTLHRPSPGVRSASWPHYRPPRCPSA